MNSYLVLIDALTGERPCLSDSERFDYYKKWGQHLSLLDKKQKLVSGSGLGKNVHTITRTGKVKSRTKKSTLESYMILKAKNVEELISLLNNSPNLDRENAEINIYELDPKPV